MIESKPWALNLSTESSRRVHSRNIYSATRRRIELNARAHNFAGLPYAIRKAARVSCAGRSRLILETTANPAGEAIWCDRDQKDARREKPESIPPGESYRSGGGPKIFYDGPFITHMPGGRHLTMAILANSRLVSSYQSSQSGGIGQVFPISALIRPCSQTPRRTGSLAKRSELFRIQQISCGF